MKKKKKLKKRQPKQQLDCYGVKLENGKTGKITRSYDYFRPDEPFMRGLGDVGKL